MLMADVKKKKPADPILEKANADGILGKKLSEIDLSKPFVNAKSVSEKKLPTLKPDEVQEYLDYKIGLAMAAGDKAAMEALIDKGASVNAPCHDDEVEGTLLTYSIFHKHDKMIKFLIGKGRM